MYYSTSPQVHVSHLHVHVHTVAETHFTLLQAVKFFQFPPRGGGVVVNVSSMSYRAPSKYLAVYAASKVLSVCLGPL